MKSRYIVVGGLLCMCGFMLGRMSVTERCSLKVERFTDTVVVRQPEVMVVHTVSRDTVRLAAVEAGCDSAAVIVPRQQAEYAGEGYRAWVSGFRPSLDSICVERVTIMPHSPPKRWTVGLQGGIGLTPRGMQPYIGVGVAYNFHF